MPRYRKKPVVVEAIQITKSNIIDVVNWCSGDMVKTLFFDGRKDIHSIEIQTLEGTIRAETGDWIIKGVRGEFYPCKPDIFAETYEPEDHSVNEVERLEARLVALEQERDMWEREARRG